MKLPMINGQRRPSLSIPKIMNPSVAKALTRPNMPVARSPTEVPEKPIDPKMMGE